MWMPSVHTRSMTQHNSFLASLMAKNKIKDEPTSGLDSHSALSLMDVLKKISDAGATVIVTIHQPPPPVVRKIDNLLLLLGGRLMYVGPMRGCAVEDKFAAGGFPKPEDYNIADWILVRVLYAVVL